LGNAAALGFGSAWTLVLSAVMSPNPPLMWSASGEYGLLFQAKYLFSCAAREHVIEWVC
jgi:hypothetical protein